MSTQTPTARIKQQTHSILTDHKTHLGIVMLAGVLARIALVDDVGVWGDVGFYTYDARLILRGEIPFVDFIGRSPLFNYLYAAVYAVTDRPVLALRAFISTWWVLTAVPVYLWAKHVRGHAAGLVAASVSLLTPFALVYGMWGNTQSPMALLACTAAYVTVKRQTVPRFAAAGAMLGLAFMSRRSVVGIMLGLAAYHAWLAYRDTDTLRSTAARVMVTGGVAAAAFFAAVTTVYVLMARGDLSLAADLFRVHTVGLVTSSGRGGFPLLGMPPPAREIVVAKGRVPVLNDICQRCGQWTARTFAKTLLVTLPAVGALFPYFADMTTRRFDKQHSEYLWGILAVLALYGAVRAGMAGYYVRVLAIAALAAYAYLAHKTGRIDRSVLYHPASIAALCVLCGLAAGYLYRNRVIHTYYFMDFYPYISVLAGVLYVEIWSGLGTKRGGAA